MSTLSVPFGSGVCRYLDCPTKTPQANGTHASVKDPGFAPGVLLPRPSRHNWLAYHDTCPFPTPASPRYHVSRGVGWLGSFPEPVALPAQMGQIGTKWDRKTILLKIAGPVPRRFRGAKTGQNGNKSGHCPDISGQNPDKNPQPPRSNVRKCPLLSGILSFSASHPRVLPGPSQNPGKFERIVNDRDTTVTVQS